MEISAQLLQRTENISQTFQELLQRIEELLTFLSSFVTIS